jgi:hypothetical protein
VLHDGGGKAVPAQKRPELLPALGKIGFTG